MILLQFALLASVAVPKIGWLLGFTHAAALLAGLWGFAVTGRVLMGMLRPHAVTYVDVITNWFGGAALGCAAFLFITYGQDLALVWPVAICAASTFWAMYQRFLLFSPAELHKRFGISTGGPVDPA